LARFARRTVVRSRNQNEALCSGRTTVWWRRESPDVAPVGAVLEGVDAREADFLGASLRDARYAPEDLAGALHLP
jgi:uncharacterized protein YjbI with pentapeptide repeats